MTAAKVKICGIKNRETIALLKQLPVDYIGFVFADSKRKVTPEQAASLIGALKSADEARGTYDPPETVGVFVNPGMDELRELLSSCRLDVVQLHGSESASFCRDVKDTFGVKLFKVFSVRNEQDDGRLEASFEPYAGVIDALMLDTHDPVYGGGSGKAFRWSVIPKAARWCNEQGIPLIVAGGLHADNVAELIAEYHPDGVDVSSGVETNGEKDEEKIKQFVGRVKR